MRFRNYRDEDYEAVCSFLREVNEADKVSINWNWARFEWMYEHPEFDASQRDKFGLWLEGDRVVGVALYDMYFGEAHCGVLPEYLSLYPEVLEYAAKELRDESGLGVAIGEHEKEKISLAEQCGFVMGEETENLMRFDVAKTLSYMVPSGCRIEELDPAEEPYDFQWVLWQGFDHGEDEDEFREKETIRPQIRKHFRKELSLTMVREDGTKAGYVCLWYDERTDYAYVEPVCVAPSHRGQGIAKCLVYEAIRRAAALGAKSAYVISDMDFYKKLGFEMDKKYRFYWKA